jgi:hypothetical protein
MARNHKFYFDKNGNPRARGATAEKPLMTFLEVDVQGSDHICRDLMDDVTAIEDGSDDLREFTGNAHQVVITPRGVTIAANGSDDTTAATVPVANPDAGHSTESAGYTVALKHFREVLEDWEAFILDDLLDDPRDEDEYQ